MDGKLLILCDELPDYIELEGEKKKRDYKVYDKNFLVSPMRDPADDPERLFVCWDSIVPEDRSFIEACKYYARFTEKPASTFALSQKGATDPRHGTIQGSVQEQSYLDTFLGLTAYLGEVKKSGGDIYGEIMERSVHFPFEANQRFFEDFSKLLGMNNVVRILPTYGAKTHTPTVQYRASILEAWKNSNRIMQSGTKSGAKVLSPMVYSDFGDVYKRSIDEMMKIYSLPIFGEKDVEEEQNK